MNYLIKLVKELDTIEEISGLLFEELNAKHLEGAALRRCIQAGLIKVAANDALEALQRIIEQLENKEVQNDESTILVRNAGTDTDNGHTNTDRKEPVNKFANKGNKNGGRWKK